MSEIMSAMDGDVAKLPQWVQIWINVLGPLVLISSIALLFNAATRKLAVVSLVLLILGSAVVIGLHSQMGMVRLLGVGHLLFWLPLLIILVNRLRRDPPVGFAKIAMYVLSVTVAVTLAFDVVDVVRWLVGERGLIV